MPLLHDDAVHLTAAQGYVELGMYSDAEEELQAIDPVVQALPEILGLRLTIYYELEEWNLIEAMMMELAHEEPDNVRWRVLLAYATCRNGSIKAARDILRAAFKNHEDMAVIPFNLACYECLLGNLNTAKEMLRRAFKLDPNLRLVALEDEELKPLWGFIG